MKTKHLRILSRVFEVRLILFFVLSMAICGNSSGQDIDPFTKEPSYDKYLPENSLISSRRIKYIIDSNEFILPGKLNVKVYDISGRLIGDINRTADSFDNPFIYRINGDTTFRLKYNKDRTKLICFERFVQNKKGKILSYLDCCNYYFKNDSYYVGYEEFYYDEKDRLVTRLKYFKEDYPGHVSDTTNIKPAELQLNDIIYYSYKMLKNGTRLIIGKHAIGDAAWRAIDSTLYDNQNRIKRFNSFAKIGAIGESRQNNVNRITEYTYQNNSLTITSYITYCRLPLSDVECADMAKTETDITLIIYNDDKTKKEVYGFYTSGEKYLKSRYKYECY